MLPFDRCAVKWSGRSGSNRRHSAWEADVLPLNYARISRLDMPPAASVQRRARRFPQTRPQIPPLRHFVTSPSQASSRRMTNAAGRCLRVRLIGLPQKADERSENRGSRRTILLDMMRHDHTIRYQSVLRLFRCRFALQISGKCRKSRRHAIDTPSAFVFHTSYPLQTPTGLTT